MVFPKGKRRPNENGRKVGRPKTKKRASHKGCRKRVPIAHASKKTLLRRAAEISGLLNGNLLERIQEMNNPDSSTENTQCMDIVESTQRTENTENSDVSQSTVEYSNEKTKNKERIQVVLPPREHTKESALAFYLDNDYSKKKYCNLVKDSNDRNCGIYPVYRKIQRAMIECKPLNIEKSEVPTLRIRIVLYYFDTSALKMIRARVRVLLRSDDNHTRNRIILSRVSNIIF